MKKLLVAVLAFLSLSLANGALAGSATDNNRTILVIGTQSGAAYIAISPAPSISGGCLFGILYVSDLSTAAGKAFYATLLTAYSQGKPLSRVDYANSSSGGQCFISLLEVS